MDSETYFRALDAFIARTGHARVPNSHIERVDAEEVRLGYWVAYQRRRHRQAGLHPAVAQRLEQAPGWTWGPLSPGPAPKAERDAEIRLQREAGLSLAQIGAIHGISRQRVHQVLRGSR